MTAHRQYHTPGKRNGPNRIRTRRGMKRTAPKREESDEFRCDGEDETTQSVEKRFSITEHSLTLDRKIFLLSGAMHRCLLRRLHTKQRDSWLVEREKESGLYSVVCIVIIIAPDRPAVHFYNNISDNNNNGILHKCSQIQTRTGEIFRSEDSRSLFGI